MGAWGVNKLGTINNTVEELWNSEPLKKLRKKMINGEDISFCDKHCNNSINSCKRHVGLDLIDYVKKSIISTENDGRVKDVNFIAWNVIESNKCNLKCSYCNVKYSSRYGEKFSTFDSPEQMFETYRDHLDVVQEIWFASGESALQPGYYKILKALIEKNRLDVRIRYITNMSTYTLNGENIFELLNCFKAPIVFGSIDDMNERVEYIRFGSSFKKITETRIKLKEYSNIKFYIQPVISVFNIFSFFDFHKKWIEEGLATYDSVRYFVLDSPEWMQYNILPINFKLKAAAKLTEYQNFLNKNLTDKVDMFPNKMHPSVYLEKIKNQLFYNNDKKVEYSKLLLEKFINETKTLDNNSNNLKFDNIFTEFQDLKKYL
jgi:sulfatase maturation enzyme AslB (radical SAM superfamily)